MSDVFRYVTNPDEIEIIRSRMLNDPEDIRRIVREFGCVYNDPNWMQQDDEPINGFVDFYGEVVCISCMYGWIFEFDEVEPSNYVRYIDRCYMVCSQCDTTVQPWVDEQYCA